MRHNDCSAGKDNFSCSPEMFRMSVCNDDGINIGKTKVMLRQRFFQNACRLSHARIDQGIFTSLEKIDIDGSRLTTGQRKSDAEDIRQNLNAAFVLSHQTPYFLYNDLSDRRLHKTR